MGTRDELRAQAERYDFEAEKLEHFAEKLQERAEGLRRTAEKIREAADALPDDVNVPIPDGLRLGEQTDSFVHENMTPEQHGMAVSMGRGRARKNRLVMAANASKMTLRQLADAVSERLGRKIHVSQLSMAQGETPRPIPRDVADAIEAITGFRAVNANWPGKIS